MPHREPSPRDLIMHTQSIMQSALIKTKLEEQRENYRKRQEQQQAQQMQSQQRIASPVNSPSKQMMSPTPLAFTPTSVLRKMTAEKEPDGANNYHRHNIELILTPARKINRYNRNRSRNNNNNNNDDNQDSRENAIEGKDKHKQIINKSSRSGVLSEMNNNEEEQTSTIALESKYADQNDNKGKDSLDDNKKQLQVAIWGGNNNNSSVIINSLVSGDDNKNLITVGDVQVG